MTSYAKQDKREGRFFKTYRGYVLAALCVGVGLLLLLFFGGRETTADTSSTDADTYAEALEKSVSELCASVEGVGRCRVMITFCHGEQTVYDGSKVSTVCPPKVQGVTVVCTGGNDPAVRQRLCDMLGALFDIGSHRVVVLPLKK